MLALHMGAFGSPGPCIPGFGCLSGVCGCRVVRHRPMFIKGVCPLQTTQEVDESPWLGCCWDWLPCSRHRRKSRHSSMFTTRGRCGHEPAAVLLHPAGCGKYGGYYTPQYSQPTYAPQPTQNYYTPQYYQPTQEAATTAGSQIIQTAYTTPVDTAATQPAQAAPTGYGGDPYGFLSWLNSTRASYGLGPVNYDQNLSNWAAMNNSQQMARGLGHFVMGPARRQNSAMGGGFPGAMWMASPAHRAALLDPTISWIGIAAAGRTGRSTPTDRRPSSKERTEAGAS